MRINSSILKGIAAAGCIYSIYGLNSVFCKNILNGEIMSPYLIFTLRTSVACILFWITSLFSNNETINTPDRRRIIYASLLCIIIPQYATLIGLQFSTPFDVSIISSLKPIITLIIACILGKEVFDIRNLAGITIAMVGVWLLTANINDSNTTYQTTWQGLILLLANGISFAFYLILFKDLTQRYSTVTLLKWMLLIASLVSIPFSIKEFPIILQLPFNWMLISELIFITLFATFICNLLMPIGQRNLTATQYSILSYLQCIVASIFGIAMGLDELSFRKITALVLIVAGVAVIQKISKA